ncbi:unnamed protein product, partial [Mesorhabditis belari]|uniref:Negative elongation factor E n=1 Tax=Mesorhabditis belari TaxID=2138241 RepID=A0AAF3ESL1_9BILA
MKELQLIFPTAFTEEEIQLKAIQERLKHLRKILNNRVAPLGSREDRESQNDKNRDLAKRNFELALKTEELRKKIASGAITLKKADDKMTFKRAKIRNRSSGSYSGEAGELASPPGMMSPPIGSPPSTPWSSDDKPPEMGKGKILFIRGYDLQVETLESAFRKFGEIENTRVEDRQRVAYMTFKSMEGLDEVIKEMDGNMVNGVTLRVSYAKKQGTTTFRNPAYIPQNNRQTTQRTPEKRAHFKMRDEQAPAIEKLMDKELLPPIPKIKFKPVPKPQATGNESPEEGEIDDEEIEKSDKTEKESEAKREMMTYENPFL